jgi:ribonuclease HI
VVKAAFGALRINMETVTTIQVHGVCEKVGNQTIATYAWIALNLEGQKIKSSAGRFTGPDLTNNSVLYLALIEALKWAKEEGQFNFEVQTCATLLANQASGRWACHAPTLIPLLHTTMELLGYANASIEYTDKETNRAVKGAWLAFEKIRDNRIAHKG